MTLDPHKDMTAALLQEDEPIKFKARIVERTINGNATNAFSLMVGISNTHELMPVVIADKYVRLQMWEDAEELAPLLAGFAAQVGLCSSAPIDHMTGFTSCVKGKGSKDDKYCGYAEMRPNLGGVFWAEVDMDTGYIILHSSRKAAQAAASDIMDWLSSSRIDWTKTPISDSILGH